MLIELGVISKTWIRALRSLLNEPDGEVSTPPWNESATTHAPTSPFVPAT